MDPRATSGGRGPAIPIRSVEVMVTTTSSLPDARRRELSPAVAALLAIGGNILVVGIAAFGLAGVAVAAMAVFGAGVLDAL